jgi:gamma-glutamyltranspeptidase/glutathione hydrolase
MKTLRIHLGIPLLLVALTFFGLNTARVNPPASVQVQRVAYPDPVRAENGMVVSAHIEASKAGVEVLKAGGNAVDAAVATGFALAVTFPVAGNIGGGGFMVVRKADGTTTTYDYREKAPAASYRDMYLDAQGNFVPAKSQRGHLASGVPGSVAGLLKAQAAHGKLPLARVMAPAIRLALSWKLNHNDAGSFNSFYDEFSKYASTTKYFTKGAKSKTYQADEILHQTDLAATLQRIRQFGRDGFYKGRTADLIVAEMQRGGGIITKQDLANYEAIERKPVTGTYRGYKIISMPPPSSGGIALMQLLNAVEPYNLKEMGLLSSETVHLMSEAERRVYADRSEWLGDPDFFNVPQANLMKKSYMKDRMKDFDPAKATPSTSIKHGEPAAYESSETTHYSVVDKEGNAVAVTTTLNGAYGSMVVVDGAGFFLNNEMDDFSAKPGVPNMFGLIGTEANAIAPNKRMLSSMTPTIVEDPQGRLFMVAGSPGGSTIITTVFQVITDVIDHGLNIQEAVSLPRFHHQWLPDQLFFERMTFPADVQRNLRAKGWNLSERKGTSGLADCITVGYETTSNSTDPSGLNQTTQKTSKRVFFGGADPRNQDTAIGF